MMWITTKTTLILFVLLSLFYVLPATGVFNGLSVGPIAFNVFILVALLACFVLLAVVWFVSPSTKQEVKELQEESEK